MSEREVIQLALRLDAWERDWEKLPPIRPGLMYFLAEKLIEDVTVSEDRL